MADKENSDRKKLMKELSKLPRRLQMALVWMATHYEGAVEMCKESTFAKEELKNYINQAIIEEDYAMLVLFILYKQLSEEDN